MICPFLSDSSVNVNCKTDCALYKSDPNYKGCSMSIIADNVINTLNFKKNEKEINRNLGVR